MRRLVNRIIGEIVVLAPLWLWMCAIHSLAGLAMGLIVYIISTTLNRSTDPIVIILGGIGGLIFGIFNLARR